ncbi:CASP-like protein 5A2 [Bidens hawaiensis]|uniref:CASP-like protein 5A2 n=1 Tax=Bidens hawaiensis TaxID=980011 RepID=UPI00404B53BD
MSSRSHPAVHPLDIEISQLTEIAPPVAENNNNNGLPDDRVRMKDIQGMPGTPANLALRFCQFGFSAISVAVMAATSDFPSVTAFRYLVGALSLQCLWSLSLAFIDVYAFLGKRSLRNSRIVALFTIGDGITSTLTFAAACASAGITVLIGNDFNNCAQNHCTRFETSTAMAFVSWFAVSPSFFLNFWYLASG